MFTHRNHNLKSTIVGYFCRMQLLDGKLVSQAVKDELREKTNQLILTNKKQPLTNHN